MCLCVHLCKPLIDDVDPVRRTRCLCMLVVCAQLTNNGTLHHKMLSAYVYTPAVHIIVVGGYVGHR